MRRRLLCLTGRLGRSGVVIVAGAAVVLAAPGPAMGEQVRVVERDGVATCLRATGSGGLALLGPPRRGSFGTDVLTVSPTGTQPAGSVVLGRLDECAAAAAGGGGAVVAGRKRVGRRDLRVVASVRDPGRAFAAPVVVGRGEAVALAAAMSARGDAAVAWIESRPDRGPARRADDIFDAVQTRLLVTTRAPGGAFGAAREVYGWSAADGSQGVSLEAAFDASGALSLAWARPRGPSGDLQELSDIETAVVAPGGAPGPRQVLARARQDVARVALAVDAGGSSLVGFASTTGVELFERAAAGTAFAGGGPVDAPGSGGQPDDVAVALSDDAAVIAWRDVGVGGPNGTPRVISVRTRPPGRPFGPAHAVEVGGAESGIFGSVFLTGAGPPFDRARGARLQVALGPGGRGVMTWIRAGAHGRREARAALLGPDGPTAVRALGTPCRRAAGVATLIAGAGPFVAFIDNRETDGSGFPAAGGALHVIGADELTAPRTAAPAPVARVRVAAPRRLRYGQRLAVPVTCDRDCAVLVQVEDRDGEEIASAGVTARAGTQRRAVLDPGELTLIVPARGGVPLRVTACAPDGTSSTVTTAVQPAQQVPPRAALVPRDVRARRSGRRIVVTWKIARPQRRIAFTVIGEGADVPPDDGSRLAQVPGRLRTRFRVVLRPDRPRAITHVTVGSRTLEPPFRGRERTVRVR